MSFFPRRFQFGDPLSSLYIPVFCVLNGVRPTATPVRYRSHVSPLSCLLSLSGLGWEHSQQTTQLSLGSYRWPACLLVAVFYSRGERERERAGGVLFWSHVGDLFGTYFVWFIGIWRQNNRFNCIKKKKKRSKKKKNVASFFFDAGRLYVGAHKKRLNFALPEIAHSS